MLEPGEVVVVSFDKIRELISRIGVSIEGKLYITNYRVSKNFNRLILLFRYYFWRQERYSKRARVG